MDISIKCQMSLSKKLRALIQGGDAKITLVCNNITDGRGEANLIVSSDKTINVGTADFMGKETSIMLTPIGLEDVTVNPNAVGSLFSKQTTSKKATNIRKTPIDRLAAIEEPEDDDISYSIKNQDEIDEGSPEVFKNPEFKQYIQTMEDLNAAIDAAKYKSSDIDISKIQDPRKRAEAIEVKEKSEAIDADAYIVNYKCANLAINDLGINLPLNMPYNLANISAKRLLGSNQLRAMFKSDMIKFIGPNEIKEYVKKAERAIEKPGLEVYSTPEEAEASMSRNGMRVDSMPLDMEQLDEPTENETILTNLTPRRQVNSGGTIRTTHGNSSLRSSRTVSQDQQEDQQDQKENSKGLKTIKRTGLSYNR